MLHRSGVWLAAVSCCAALLLSSSPVGAGLGGLVKKAKEKVNQAASPTPEETVAAAEDRVVFDDVTLELNGDRLDHILATFKAASAAATGRSELVRKLNALSEEQGKLWEKDGEAIRETQRQRGDIEICYHDGYEAARDKRTQEYAQKAMSSDPATLAKLAQIAQQNNAASAKGDSAATARAQQGMMAMMLPTKEDSADVRKSCGPLPPKGASERRIEEIDKQMAPINEAIRKIDEKVAEAQSKQGGLNRQQWGMAVERIQMLLSLIAQNENKSKSKGKSSSGSGSGSGSGSDSGSGSLASAGVKGFTQIELEAIEKRLAQLREYLGG